MQSTHNVHVGAFRPLPPPRALREDIAASPAAAATVVRGRDALSAALRGEDKRWVVVVGPCSIHDPKSALEYAERLAALQAQVQDKVLLVMRVYFEKPRTTVGWKGLLYDPGLDGSNQIEAGLRQGRELLAKFNEMGLPCATEFLDPIVPQYMADLVSWAAIGARTTESQTHRQMASGLSMPVGFKNATDGGLKVALNAMQSALTPHSFVGVGPEGQVSMVQTTGNPDVHLVLRGGNKGPNWDPDAMERTRALLQNHKFADPEAQAQTGSAPRLIMVDCSHDNSNKDYRKQPDVYRSVLQQFVQGGRDILGVMLESHLVEGKQALPKDKSALNDLTYGQSVTDGCIGWATTERLILEAHNML